MHVVALTAENVPEYRELMLEAYVQAADAFTSTAEDRVKEPLSWWVNRIAAPSGLAVSFGAFQEGRLVGTVALEFTTKPKTRHSAMLIGMYVQPVVRRLGAGAQLVHAAIGAARSRPELEVLRLTVTEGNEPAIRLYQSAGFSAWGTEPHGFKGKVHMSMFLGNAAAAA